MTNRVMQPLVDPAHLRMAESCAAAPRAFATLFTGMLVCWWSPSFLLFPIRENRLDSAEREFSRRIRQRRREPGGPERSRSSPRDQAVANTNQGLGA